MKRLIIFITLIVFTASCKKDAVNPVLNNYYVMDSTYVNLSFPVTSKESLQEFINHVYPARNISSYQFITTPLNDSNAGTYTDYKSYDISLNVAPFIPQAKEEVRILYVGVVKGFMYYDFSSSPNKLPPLLENWNNGQIPPAYTTKGPIFLQMNVLDITSKGFINIDSGIVFFTTVSNWGSTFKPSDNPGLIFTGYKIQLN